MSIAATSGVPVSFNAGDTVRFTITDAEHPPSAWSLAFVLNNGVAVPTSTTASESGDIYTVVITAAATASLAPGLWPWALIYTESGTNERATGQIGSLTITPNPTATAVPSYAQTQVTALQATLTSLSTRKAASRSFNGQSSTDVAIENVQKQLVYWQAAVLREQATAAAARGELTGNTVAPLFLPVSGAPIGPFRTL